MGSPIYFKFPKIKKDPRYVWTTLSIPATILPAVATEELPVDCSALPNS